MEDDESEKKDQGEARADSASGFFLTDTVVTLTVALLCVAAGSFQVIACKSWSREITLFARGMKLTRLCSRTPVAALLPAHVRQSRRQGTLWDRTPTSSSSSSALSLSLSLEP